MSAAIKVEKLDKVYRSGGKGRDKHALKAIDLEIPRGSIFGLLGPNGAGKSTFINILAGLVNKTSGKANIWGFDIDENPRNAKVSIGVVPQELYFDVFFTPLEMLELQAGLYGVPKEERRTFEILETVKLTEEANAYTRTLSGGMKRRLLVAKAMVHSPPILVLDEPTAGVDIELRQLLWESVRRMHERGVTIVLTTHYLEEAQMLCDRIAIINHGEVVACDTTEKLLSRIDEKEILFDLCHELSEIPEALKPFHCQLVNSRRIAVQINKSTTSVGEVLSAISNAGVEIQDLFTRDTDLEDIFLQLTQSK